MLAEMPRTLCMSEKWRMWLKHYHDQWEHRESELWSVLVRESTCHFRT